MVNYEVYNDVLFGYDDWLFVYQGSNHIHDHLQGKFIFSELALLEWEKELQSRKKFCLNHHAEYFFIIAPLKQCVYWDKLPKKYKINQIRPAIQLSTYLSVYYPLEIIEILRSKNRQLYYKYDSHWNDFCSLKVFEHVLGMRGIENFNLDYCETPKDLWIKISSERVPFDRCYKIKENRIVFDNGIENVGGLLITKNCQQSQNKAVIFGDSFSRFTLNSLSSLFSEIYFFHISGFDRNIIEQIKPQVVINCQAENFISTVSTIRFKTYFEALFYKFIISGKFCLQQSKFLPYYKQILTSFHYDIIEKIILLFRVGKFNQQQVLEFLIQEYNLPVEDINRIFGK